MSVGQNAELILEDGFNRYFHNVKEKYDDAQIIALFKRETEEPFTEIDYMHRRTWLKKARDLVGWMFLSNAQGPEIETVLRYAYICLHACDLNLDIHKAREALGYEEINLKYNPTYIRYPKASSSPKAVPAE